MGVPLATGNRGVTEPMKTAVHLDASMVADITFQPASMDIWEPNTALLRKTVPPSMRPSTTPTNGSRGRSPTSRRGRVREHCYDEFLWALRRGAIPAGRIVSNAGARGTQAATSTINCTVSGTVADSMDDILNKVHEAGLTLKSGCGIGYEFSTLRPKGAYVIGRRRVYLGSAVVHGYLRQDVLYGVVRRAAGAAPRWGLSTSATRTSWTSSAPSARTDGCGNSTFRCSSPTNSCRPSRTDADWHLAFPVKQAESNRTARCP